METCQAQSPSASRRRNAPALPFLPDELIVEILSWLPVKYLLQFRCVCKLWKSVISDSNFVKLHLQRSSGNARKANLLIQRSEYSSLNSEYVCRFVPCYVNPLMGNPSYTIDEDNCYTLNHNTCGYHFLGSCNGLVCLLNLNRFNGDKEYCFYLWNPATKLTSNKLACLHVDHFYRFGFGYDILSDTYKVFAFSLQCEAKPELIQVKICSLGDNCWRSIHSFPVVPLFPLHFLRHNDGVYFNGTLNWLACCNGNSFAIQWHHIISMAQLVIVSFDLGMETYKQLLPPPLDEAPRVEPTIGVLMDCLCFSHQWERTHFVVWQMKEFGVEVSWTQFVRVRYQYLQIDCLDIPFPLLPLCMSENGNVLIMVTAARQVIMYHWRDNRVEQIKLPKYIYYWNGIIDYVESLVSPCSN